MAGPGKDEGGVTRVTQAVSLTKMEGEVAKGFGRGRFVELCPTSIWLGFKKKQKFGEFTQCIFTSFRSNILNN